MESEPQVTIIGGGIVGLATALALTDEPIWAAPLVVEKEPTIASHQTGHNSGVIHSGIYYRPGSLKARFAVTGARRLGEFCREQGLTYETCGKVIIAADAAEVARLEELHRRGQANGVPGIEMVGPERLREIEPHAVGVKALYVPGTGVVDFVAVAHRYADLVRERGGEIRTDTRVVEIRRDGGRWSLETTTGTIRTPCLVNCAGLDADRIAERSGLSPAVCIVPFRGEYYFLSAERQGLVRRLIYPVPDPGFPFLGAHLTRTIHGRVEAGPNAVLSLKREGYGKTDFSVRDTWRTLTFPGSWRLAARYWRTGLGEVYRSISKRAFVCALQRLVPDLREEDLQPGGSGVRAQAVSKDGALIDDFCIETAENAIHVLNAPSPAATASLPIGAAIAARAREHFGWQ